MKLTIKKQILYKAMVSKFYLVSRRAVAATAIIMTPLASLAHGSDAYHPSRIGTPGKPWGVDEYKQWSETRSKQRCYTDLAPHIRALGEIECRRSNTRPFEVVQYGDLAYHDGAADPPNSSSFPLYGVRSKSWLLDKPNVFISRGVHGYKTSGVEGAMLFVTGGKAAHYS